LEEYIDGQGKKIHRMSPRDLAYVIEKNTGTGTYGTGMGIEIRPKNESNAMEKMSLIYKEYI
jgi:ribosomal protein S6